MTRAVTDACTQASLWRHSYSYNIQQSEEEHPSSSGAARSGFLANMSQVGFGNRVSLQLAITFAIS